MCYVDPASASGYFYPRQLLRRAGINPDKDLGKTLFVKSHSAVARALIDGRCDAGGLASNVLTQWRDEAGLRHKPSAIRILSVSSPIPGDAVVMRHDTPEPLADAIRRAFKKIIDLSSLGEQPGDLKSLIAVRRLWRARTHMKDDKIKIFGKDLKTARPSRPAQ